MRVQLTGTLLALVCIGLATEAQAQNNKPKRLTAEQLTKKSLPLRTALHHDPTMRSPLERLVKLYRRAGRLEELVGMYRAHSKQGADEMAKKILIVDDEEKIMSLLKVRLESKGYEVTATTKGEDCIKLAQEHQPDLLILDICMPGIDGLQAFEQLRGNRRTKDIPVIFLTALHKTDEANKHGTYLGNQIVLPKPFNEVELVKRVREALKET